MDYINIQNNEKEELDILFYEILMLNFCEKFRAKNELENNIKLESFLVHARNLIDFLECKKLTNDDISACDFEDKNGQNIVKIQVDLDQRIKTKINKHLSHPTKTRLGEKIGWNMGEIKEKINNGLKEFLKKINDSYFPTKQNRNKEDFLSLLD